MTTPVLPPPPPAGGSCPRHPCPQCQREYNEALWIARRKKYEGPELAFWGGLAALICTPMAAALLAGHFFFDTEGPQLWGGPFALTFGSFLGIGALCGAGLLAKGIQLWKNNPIDWENPP